MIKTIELPPAQQKDKKQNIHNVQKIFNLNDGQFCVLTTQDMAMIYDTDLNEVSRVDLKLKIFGKDIVKDALYLHDTSILICSFRRLFLFDYQTDKSQEYLCNILKILINSLIGPKKNYGQRFLCCNSNENYVCVGTEYSNQESAVFIWDIKEPEQPKYKIFESFGNDIAQVSFHPLFSDILITASTDGLICIFDISQLKVVEANIVEEDSEDSFAEDDALLFVINTDCSIQKFGYFGEESQYIWVLSDLNHLSLWSLRSLKRIEYANQFDSEECIVDCFYESLSKKLYLVTQNEKDTFIHNILTLKCSQKVQIENAHLDEPLNGIFFLSQQRSLVTFAHDSKFAIQNVNI